MDFDLDHFRLRGTSYVKALEDRIQELDSQLALHTESPIPK